jgi:hypothetical protein
VEVKPVSTSQVSQMQELIYAVLPDVEQMANVSLSISEAIFLSLRMLAFVMMVGLENYANSIPVLERAARAMANALQQVIKMLYVYAMTDSQEKAVRIAVMVSVKAPIHWLCPKVAGAVKLGCTKDGHCNYLNYGQQYPWPGFCTYREAVTQSNCLCGSENDCEATVSCSSNGSCPSPQYLLDATPCNSVPFGTCQSGICVGPLPVSAAPTTKPIQQVRSYCEIVVRIMLASSYPVFARYQFDPQL